MAERPTRITLWGIEIFLATLETGSISGAAKRLSASPSSVSQQLTNLEAALEKRLIDRAARPVVLTPAGKLFHRRALSILSEAYKAQSELAGQDISHLSQLRIGMIEDFDSDVTPRLLAEMSEELKSCHFVLETGASYHLAAMLESRALDVIVAADLDLSRDGVESHALLKDPFIIAAPPGAIDDQKDVPAQLLAMPFIRYSNRQMMGRQIEAHLTAAGLQIPHRFELDSYHAIMAMVAGGAGWTITTPLGVMRAHRFRNEVDIMAMPFSPFSRQVSLFAPEDRMERIAADIAKRLRPMLQEYAVEPCLKEMPWLKGAFQVL